MEFKLIVAGSRGFKNYPLLSFHIMYLAHNTYKNMELSIVSGCARGADAMAIRFAHEHDVVLYEFPADWGVYGKRAGFVRNADMGKHSDGLLAFWDGHSRGTKNMIDFMHSLNKPVHVIQY